MWKRCQQAAAAAQAVVGDVDAREAGTIVARRRALPGRNRRQESRKRNSPRLKQH